MSLVAADVLADDAYVSPSANLVDNDLSPVKDKAFSTEGRLGVLSFNARYMLAMVVIIVSFVPFFTIMASSENPNFNGPASWVALAFMFTGLIAGCAFMIVSSIKRLHDLGMGGWHYLKVLIPIFGTFWMLYVSLKPAADRKANRFGVTKAVTTSEKVIGIVGIVFMVLVMLGSVFDTVSKVGQIAGA